MDRSKRYVAAVTGLLGLGMLGAGAWSWTDPHSFAEFAAFPVHVHFLHDLGAFMLGIGVMLMLALVWRDALATVLTGFLIANTIHAINHGMDLDLGGRAVDAWALAIASVASAIAVWLRLRQLGYVVGEVALATSEALAPLVRQKTIQLTTYRRDGTPGASPVSIAVEGDRAYVRSFEKAIKTQRLRRNPHVEIAPSTGFGTPSGPRLRAQARRLHDAEAARAARLLARKYPFLHGILVPTAHRMMRRKTGQTVYFELVPVVDENVAHTDVVHETVAHSHAARATPRKPS
jgi:PPOX class probable F420-dependent enzyme